MAVSVIISNFNGAKYLPRLLQSLQAQQGRLSSPAYIEQLARQELNMCFPGTRCYIVEGGQPRISPAASFSSSGWPS